MMEWLGGLLVISGLWFWLFIIVINIGIVLLEEHDYNFWPVILVVLTVLAIQASSAIHPLSWLAAHPLGILAGVGIYLVAGVFWSFFKWWDYLIDQRDDVLKNAAKYVGISFGVTNAETIAEAARQRENRLKFLQSNLPNASDNKARITHWMAFWPWSVLAFLLSDFLQKIFRLIYERLQGVYERMAQHVFAGVITEIAASKKEKTDVKAS